MRAFGIDAVRLAEVSMLVPMNARLCMTSVGAVTSAKMPVTSNSKVPRHMIRPTSGEVLCRTTAATCAAISGSCGPTDTLPVLSAKKDQAL
jgi:hypothetical protein